MGNIIFASFVSPGSGQSRAALKWLFFPTSLLFHFILVAAVIAVPLMTTDSQMPEVKVIKAWMVAAMPPQPPAPPRGRGGGSGHRNKPDKKTEKPAPPKLDLKAFVAPQEIPLDIQPESLDAPGPGDSPYDPNGVDGGMDWGDSSPLFEKEVNLNSPAIQLGQLQMPKLIKQVAPQYPPTALKAHIQGIVKIEAVTDIYGRVIKAQVLEGPLLLRGAAVQAVKQWIYEPYIFNGVPKAVTFTVAIHFTLNK